VLTVFVVPVMYSLFARSKVPGAKTTVAVDTPPAHPHDPELIGK
jgi:multidrug efflux pump